jgi:hypothetical protein
MIRPCLIYICGVVGLLSIEGMDTKDLVGEDENAKLQVLASPFESAAPFYAFS